MHRVGTGCVRPVHSPGSFQREGLRVCAQTISRQLLSFTQNLLAPPQPSLAWWASRRVSAPPESHLTLPLSFLWDTHVYAQVNVHAWNTEKSLMLLLLSTLSTAQLVVSTVQEPSLSTPLHGKYSPEWLFIHPHTCPGGAHFLPETVPVMPVRSLPPGTHNPRACDCTTRIRL